MKYLLSIIFLLIFSSTVFAEPYVYSPNYGYQASRGTPNYPYNVNIIPVQPYKMYYYPGYQPYYFRAYEPSYIPTYYPGYVSAYVSPYQTYYITPNYYSICIYPIQTSYGTFYIHRSR